MKSIDYCIEMGAAVAAVMRDFDTTCVVSDDGMVVAVGHFGDCSCCYDDSHWNVSGS